jgi:hypothetical protein
MNRLQRFLPPDIHKKDGQGKRESQGRKKDRGFSGPKLLETLLPLICNKVPVWNCPLTF